MYCTVIQPGHAWMMYLSVSKLTDTIELIVLIGRRILMMHYCCVPIYLRRHINIEIYGIYIYCIFLNEKI